MQTPYICCVPLQNLDILGIESKILGNQVSRPMAPVNVRPSMYLQYKVWSKNGIPFCWDTDPSSKSPGPLEE